MIKIKGFFHAILLGSYLTDAKSLQKREHKMIEEVQEKQLEETIYDLSENLEEKEEYEYLCDQNDIEPVDLLDEQLYELAQMMEEKYEIENRDSQKPQEDDIAKYIDYKLQIDQCKTRMNQSRFMEDIDFFTFLNSEEHRNQNLERITKAMAGYEYVIRRFGSSTEDQLNNFYSTLSISINLYVKKNFPGQSVPSSLADLNDLEIYDTINEIVSRDKLAEKRWDEFEEWTAEVREEFNVHHIEVLKYKLAVGSQMETQQDFKQTLQNEPQRRSQQNYVKGDQSISNFNSTPSGQDQQYAVFSMAKYLLAMLLVASL